MHGIGRHIPQLRRFARALTGSQSVGDGFVGLTLQTLIRNRRADPPHPARLMLYRAFFDLWTNSAEREDRFAGHLAHAMDLRLQQMVPLDRAVFLLQSLEGFDEAELVAITGLTAGDVSLLLEDADRDFHQTPRTTVLIIEDDGLIAADLKRIVESMGHKVVGQAGRQDTAIVAAHLLRPGLILADIRLDKEDGGLTAVDAITSRFAVPVVFVTGYPERLLRGLRGEPTYLVEKPYRESRLKAVIDQALFFHSAQAGATPSS